MLPLPLSFKSLFLTRHLSVPLARWCQIIYWLTPLFKRKISILYNQKQRSIFQSHLLHRWPILLFCLWLTALAKLLGFNSYFTFLVRPSLTTLLKTAAHTLHHSILPNLCPCFVHLCGTYYLIYYIFYLLIYICCFFCYTVNVTMP